MERHFSTAVDAILRNWVALQLTINHSGTNGLQFNSWLKESLVNWFKENENLEIQEVEGFLEDIIVTEFNVEIDDGSYSEVAGLICRFFTICSSQPEDQVLNQLRALPKCDLSLCHTKDGEEDSVADHQNQQEVSMDVETESRPVRSAPPEPDEDGFVTVVSRKKR